MKYQFIGRTTSFKGKPLWEILANLKDFGVGRLVIRNRFQRYPEPCFMKILKVGALPPPVNKIDPVMKNIVEERRCLVLCEKTFRGKKLEHLQQIHIASYKTDYQLVPKDEEYKYLRSVEKPTKILPRTMELPPLLKELTIRHMKAKGIPITKEPQMTIVYNQRHPSLIPVVAKEGEEPTVKFSIGLGTPANPDLYANVKPI